MHPILNSVSNTAGSECGDADKESAIESIGYVHRDKTLSGNSEDQLKTVTAPNGLEHRLIRDELP